MAVAIFASCISLLQDYNAFNNGSLVVEQKFKLPHDDFYWYVSQKYKHNLTKDDIDKCKYKICGDPSQYDLFRYPEEVTKGFLTNDEKEIEKSKVALIKQIALFYNYTLSTKELETEHVWLEICLDVSLLF